MAGEKKGKRRHRGTLRGAIEESFIVLVKNEVRSTNRGGPQEFWEGRA